MKKDDTRRPDSRGAKPPVQRKDFRTEGGRTLERRPNQGGEFRTQERRPNQGGEFRTQERRPNQGGGFRTQERRPNQGGFRPGREDGRGKALQGSRVARSIALNALRDVVGNGAYASEALDRALRGMVLSDEDRRLAAGIYFTALENHLRIDWTLDRIMEKRPDPLVWQILHIAAAQLLFMDRIPDYAAVDEAVSQTRLAKRGEMTGLVNGVLRSLIRARDAGEIRLPDPGEEPAKYLSVKYSLSDAAASRLLDAYGMENCERFLGAERRRGVSLRANASRTTDEALRALLDERGIEWEEGVVPGAVVLRGAGDLSRLPEWRSGLVSIQGQSSMLAALAVGAKPGMQILDACAAPGGKTCLMAEAMQGAGRVYAWDVHEHRVELIRAAARRLRLDNVRPAVHDARKPKEDMEYAMDAVLSDVPCSGLGVMDDKPDVKFRLSEEELASLAPLQRDILDGASRHVRVGGRLVYSTCSILPCENREVVEAFLQSHPAFERDLSDEWLPEALRPKFHDGMLELMPGEDGLEGFFIACMRRRAR